ncbi:hypothetical protein IWZ01DRAFT_323890 [Phyllosticta capitalensis]
MGRLSWLFLSLSAIAGRACAQLDGATPSSETFLRRGYHSSTVGGGFVWIDGGAFSYYKNQVNRYYSNTLLALDLREDWTNDTVSFISNAKDLPAGSNPSTAPSLLYGNGLWYDDDTGYLYTGFSGLRYYSGAAGWPMELTVFKTDGEGGGTWATALNASTNAFNDMIRPMHPAVAAGNGKGYALGGTTPVNDTETEIMAGGMLSFDFETKLFRNSTVQIHGGYTSLANMVYVPQFGEEGIFVLIGGAFTQGPYDIDWYSNGEIYVMDAKTEVFYSQNTTGVTPPSGREEFCTAVVASTNETVEIFMYGGWGGTLGEEQATPYDEIYILTLPAFEWVKVDYTPAQARLAHSCEAVGGSQILVIGGLDGSTSDVTYNGTFNDRDPNEQGLAVFNMTSLDWETKYTADSPAYVQSDLVAEVYTSGTGNATWDNDNIESIFSKRNFTITSSGGAGNNGTGTGSTTSSQKSSSSSSSSSLSGGAIAGIVVGCVAGVAIVAGLLAFCCIRRRRAGGKGAAGGAPAEPQQQQHPAAEAQSNDIMELHGHDRLEMDASAKPPYQYSPLAELPGGELPAKHQMR